MAGSRPDMTGLESRSFRPQDVIWNISQSELPELIAALRLLVPPDSAGS